MQVNVTNAATLIHAKDFSITSLILKNESDVSMFVDTTPSVTESGATKGIELEPGSRITITAETQGLYGIHRDWYAIHASTGNKVVNVNAI